MEQGDTSVAGCAEYRAPEWLHRPGAPGSWRELAIPAPGLRSAVCTRVWSPAASTDRLVVAHDGADYDKLAGLGRYAAALVGAGAVAPYHLVLLAPGERDEWYSANPRYAHALVSRVLPRVRAELGIAARPVLGVGASLGALAMLHAQRRHPATFAGLFLQSGSFFRPRLDPQESGFVRYPRIVRFTGRVIRASAGPAVPVVLTCGRVEENLRNNQEMAGALGRQGYPVELHEVPDGHNYTGWRDALDPYLSDLSRRTWPGLDA